MDKLINQLKRHEGLRLKPYHCTSGALTIGYGRNLDAKGITEQEADAMLAHDVSSVAREIALRLAVHESLSDARKAVILNMAFNLGVNGTLKFKKMIKALESGNYVLASAEMLNSNWARQVGNRAKELAKQMETGEWQ